MIQFFVFSNFIILVTLIATLIATYTDFKDRIVPDWLNYGLMTVGIFAHLFWALGIQSFAPLAWSIGGGLFAYILAQILFQTNQWGGGDSKLLVAYGFCLSYLSSGLPLSLIVFVLISAIGIPYMIVAKLWKVKQIPFVPVFLISLILSYWFFI